MGCCGFPWAGGGGGGAYFPLAPDRVVVTDAAGLPAVGPYWVSAGPIEHRIVGVSATDDAFYSVRTNAGVQWSFGVDRSDNSNYVLARSGALGTTNYFVASNLSGARQISWYDAAPVAAYHFYAGQTLAVGNFIARFGNLSGSVGSTALFTVFTGTAFSSRAQINYECSTEVWSSGLDSPAGSGSWTLGRSSTLGTNPYFVASSLSTERQVSFLGATPNALVPFRVQTSRATGTYQYAFELSGGASGVFNYVVGNGGGAEIQVDTDDLSLFSLTTNNHYLRLANNDSGIAIISSSLGLDVVINDDGLQGGIFKVYAASFGDPDLVWLENGLFNYRSPYVDLALFPPLGPVDDFGDIWFQRDAAGTVHTVEFQLQIGGILYTASLPLT